jgi:enolase
MRITDLHLRGILDSRARVTVEAEVTLEGNRHGRGSSPRAIAPGRRERRRGPDVALGPLAIPDGLVGRWVRGQSELDELLTELDVGADVTLAVSLAFARAAAADQPLYAYLADSAGTTPAVPRLMANMFSGGIHAAGDTAAFQQVMLIPATDSLAGDIGVACAVFAAALQLARQRYGEPQMSASSGLVIPATSEEQLALLREAIDVAGHADVTTVGVDVAAEHLVVGPYGGDDGRMTAAGCQRRYRFGARVLTSAELAARLASLAIGYGLTYVEDPFDPADEQSWRGLRAALPPTVVVVGDDLFATDATRVSDELADGILLKPSQAGTLTATLAAASVARRMGMLIAVSHRSGETEDTAMCDLAVAVGAHLIKVGGPRRGDRLAKYNQLLRLAELLPAGDLSTATR